MAVYSILTLNPGKQLSHGLYNAETRSIDMVGSETELEQWKHRIESQEQEAQNKAHFAKLREEYLQLLVAGGNTPKMAEKFLRNRMPYLFQEAESPAK